MQEKSKKNLSTYKAIKQLFEVYRNYKFKLENQDLLKNSNLEIEEDKVCVISDFIRLVDTAMKYLSKDERAVIKMTFIDKVHYSECNCSQSTFFTKRKIACKKLHDLIFVKSQNQDLEQTIYSLKVN